MCGIAGFVNFKNINTDKVVDSLRHRGPDAQGVFHDDQITLVHTRLAIQDIKQGAQPFNYEHYIVIFNGEIYNHQALRTQLKEFNFKTQSDTETLLYLFIKYQEKMFDMLDGMFAFCIYDKKQNTITLARDRAGKKPLYYFSEKNSFAFASEINTLKRVAKLNINPDAINCYLRAGFIWKPYTPYYNVMELKAGSYLTLDVTSHSRQIISYFNLFDYYKVQQPLKFQDSLEHLDHLLQKSVQARMMASDVEVGVFLSGGIDSNLIAAMAANMNPNIKTFTVKFNGLYDESALARLTAEKYKTNHIELAIDNNLKEDIEKILLAYGEPFMDSSAIPSYYVSREARKHVKVVLSGDGADELFAGYRRYVPAAYKLNQLMKPFSFLLKALPKPNTKQSVYNYLYRLLAMSNKKGLDFYLSSTSDVFEDALRIKSNDVINNFSDFINDSQLEKNVNSLDKALYSDFSALLFCDLLVKMDIASMANSIEVRSPFLSKHLLEFAPTLPGSYKIKKFKTKFILRKLAEKYLSKELINQPKRGFEVPLKKWVDQDLRESINSYLQPGCYAENYISSTFIQHLLSKKINVSAEKRAKMLWSLYCLEVWYQNENSFHC